MCNSTESLNVLEAMKRAACIARERAARHQLHVPAWRAGKIVFVDPRSSSQDQSTITRIYIRLRLGYLGKLLVDIMPRALETSAR